MAIWTKNTKQVSPEQRTLFIHRKVRRLRKNPEALDDLAIELFLRLVGIYYTVPEDIRKEVKFLPVATQFDQLREFIDVQLASEDGKDFAKYEMPDYVHNLYLLLVKLVRLDFLEANIHNVREEYRSHVDDTTYKIYTLSGSYEFLKGFCKTSTADPQWPALKELYEEKLRVDYGNLINEIRKARLSEIHIEDTRRFLIKKVLNVYLIFISLPVVFILLHVFYMRYRNVGLTDLFTGLTGMCLFCSAAIAGATGSSISVILRIQGVRDNNQLAQNIFAFKYSKTAVQVAPFTGMVFAILLSLIIDGGLLGGTMFPAIKDNNWDSLLTDIGQLSKLLVWSFIAGFSERLVPDMLDRLSERAKKADEKLT